MVAPRRARALGVNSRREKLEGEKVGKSYQERLAHLLGMCFKICRDCIIRLHLSTLRNSAH
jgi:hypothetical protein